MELGRFAARGLTPAVLRTVALGRFAAHELTPVVLTGWNWEDSPRTG